MPIILADPDPANAEVVLDPSEVAEDRVELALNAGAIRVAQDPGIDWGDAAIESYRAALEKDPADRPAANNADKPEPQPSKTPTKPRSTDAVRDSRGRIACFE